MNAAALDVVVRIDHQARLEDLSRTVFSIALQDHRPVTILIVCRRFHPAELEAVRQTTRPLMTIAGDAALEILNHADANPPHARTALLNQRLQAGRGRYAAFIDSGDVIYPEGYRLLIAELEASGAAIAFGGLLDAAVSQDGLVPVQTSKRRVHNTVCPLHSFVLDRSRIAAEDFSIDDTLAVLEADDFLHRLCARYPSSFRSQDKIIGECVSGTTRANQVAPPRLHPPGCTPQAAPPRLHSRLHQ